MTLWQEFGRCGRDGETSRAIWYPTQVMGDENDMLRKIKSDEDCIRFLMFQAATYIARRIRLFGESCRLQRLREVRAMQVRLVQLL